MSEYIIKGETLTGIADAIRSKDGTTEPIPAGSMAQRIIDIPTGNLEAEAMLAGVIDGNIESVISPTATKVVDYAFQGRSNLKYVDLPNVESLGSNAFTNCRSLETITPLANAKSLGYQAFSGCSKLTEVIAPEITYVSNYACDQCSSLTKAIFPKISSVTYYMFNKCESLVETDFSSAKAISQRAFSSCKKLERVYFPSLTSISGGEAFSGCSALTALVISNTAAVATMNNTSALTGTAIAAGTGYVYIPAALLDEYKSASNWSVFSAQFRALEDYTVDGTVTGALDESKI